MQVLKSMEEWIIEYLLCLRPHARYLVFIIQFSHDEESYQIGNIKPFLQMRKLRLNEVNLLPKFMGLNPVLSDFRNS